MSIQQTQPMILKLVAAFAFISFIVGIFAFFSPRQPWIVFGMDMSLLADIYLSASIIIDLFILLSVYFPNKLGWYLMVFFYGFTALRETLATIRYLIFPSQQLNALWVGFILVFLFCRVWIFYAIYIEKDYFFHET